MAVKLTTSNPKNFIARLKENILDKSIATWEWDEEANILVYTGGQWSNKAGFKIQIINNNEIYFLFNRYKNSQLSAPIRSVCHGRFIEMLITHFSDDFLTVSAYAKPLSPEQTKEIGLI